jgi:hypothetical protein
MKCARRRIGAIKEHQMPSEVFSWSFSVALVLCVGVIPGRLARHAKNLEPVTIAQADGSAAAPDMSPNATDEGGTYQNPPVPLNNQNNQLPGDPAAAQQFPGEMGDNPAEEPKLGGDLDNPAAEPTPGPGEGSSDDNPPSPAPSGNDAE